MVVTPHWPIPLGHKPIDLGLERIHQCLERLGNPHQCLPPVVHVAGTNGKGSTVAFMRAMLEAAGYKVHVYTSPHLVQFNERIVLAGENVTDAMLYDVLEECRQKSEGIPLTFFEGTTAAAFLAFARVPADILLLETGLGGRLDATNFIEKPEVTVITPVSFDHMEFLGNTLQSIAAEKAGIMKPGVPCVLGKQDKEAAEVFEEKAKALGIALYRQGKEWEAVPQKDGFTYKGYKSAPKEFPAPSLYGKHQYDNAGLAVTALTSLKDFSLSEESIREGLQNVRHPARLQRLHFGALVKLLPPSWELWLDGGHNAAGGKVLAEVAASWQDKPLYLVVGMLQGKDSEGFFAPFVGKVAKVVTVPILGEMKAKEPALLAKEAVNAGLKAFPVVDITHALKLLAQETKDARVLICGSLYLAGQVLAEE